MKNSLLVLLGFLLCLSVSAQKSDGDGANFNKTTAVKINPLSIWLGNLNLSGEYNVKRKRSVTFGIGIPMEIERNVEMEGETQPITIKTFSAMAGYRFYLGKKTMSGVYFEPFAKYLDTKIVTIEEGEIEYVIGPPEQTTFLVTGSNKAIGVGVQLGAQFMIAKIFTLDLFVLGPTAYSAKPRLLVEDLSPSTDWTGVDEQEVENEVKQTVRDIPVIGDMIADKLVVNIDEANKRATASYDGFLPGFRAGISIGIRF